MGADRHRRLIGQRSDGSFEASKSKTFGVPLGRLYRAFHDARIRARWLPGPEPVLRAATREKSVRWAWPDRTTVTVWFTAKADAKSQLALAHAKLPDRETSTRMKQFWTERLAALEEVLD